MTTGRIDLRGGTATRDATEVVLRSVVVACALASAYIHASLGGLLFTLNAVGYVTLALALVVPFGFFPRVRWFTRLALLGFTSATIVGWLLMGARFPLAYLDKAIEVVLVAVLLADGWRADGPPWRALGRIFRCLTSLRNGRQKPRPVTSTPGRLTAPGVEDSPHRKVA